MFYRLRTKNAGPGPFAEWETGDHDLDSPVAQHNLAYDVFPDLAQIFAGGFRRRIRRGRRLLGARQVAVRPFYLERLNGPISGGEAITGYALNDLPIAIRR